jgi:hypothetical protein
MSNKLCLDEGMIAIVTSIGGGFNVRFILSPLVSTCRRPLGHIGQPAVSRIATRVGLYALAGTLAGAVASGMLLWVLLLL